MPGSDLIMMNKKVRLKLKKNIDESYDILISSNIDIAKEIKNTGLNNNYAIITDSNVFKIYKEKISNSFDKEKLNYQFIVVGAGEKSKRLKVLEKVSEKMIKLGFDRKSAVIALGGGVVGDLSGFIAGTFMRGIPFVQIPTTLLAQVDSSVGGKVAVDIKNGKNSSGLFYQPKKVIIDVDFLNTLPVIEFNSGMMEIIKHGIILNSNYFNFIEDDFSKISGKDKVTLVKLIHESCLLKAGVVQKDEKEKNLRMILNFGHTIGHAIETINKFKLKHGIAVGIGMIKEALISQKLGLLSDNECGRIINLINSFGIKDKNYDKNKIFKAILSDKKNSKDDKLDISIPLILPRKIGKIEMRYFSLDEMKKYI
jgi:3-dehydroquinate synthase